MSDNPRDLTDDFKAAVDEFRQIIDDFRGFREAWHYDYEEKVRAQQTRERIYWLFAVWHFLVSLIIVYWFLRSPWH